jgi:hypothetical protein
VEVGSALLDEFTLAYSAGIYLFLSFRVRGGRKRLFVKNALNVERPIVIVYIAL